MIGFLHTAEVHTATFAGLVDEMAPQSGSTHVVDPALLVDAQTRGGVDAELRVRLRDRLHEAAIGAGIVVCTCSTISGAAELLADEIGVPVIRVDRPMAERAVEIGPRIAVVAALASTIGPTTELLGSIAASTGRPVELREIVCADAWADFEAGHMDAYLDAIARAVDTVAAPVDVIVLAQASMAAVADRARTPVPILSSPRLAVAAAIAELPTE